MPRDDRYGDTGKLGRKYDGTQIRISKEVKESKGVLGSADPTKWYNMINPAIGTDWFNALMTLPGIYGRGFGRRERSGYDKATDFEEKMWKSYLTGKTDGLPISKYRFDDDTDDAQYVGIPQEQAIIIQSFLDRDFLNKYADEIKENGNSELSDLFRKKALALADSIYSNPGTWVVVNENMSPVNEYVKDKRGKNLYETTGLGALKNFSVRWHPDENMLDVKDAYDFNTNNFIESIMPKRDMPLKIRDRIKYDPKIGSLLRRDSTILDSDRFEKRYEDGGEISDPEEWMPSDSILEYIKSKEKFRSTPYDDGKGNETIGWGFKTNGLNKDYSNGMSREEADSIFNDKVVEFTRYLRKFTPNFEYLNNNQRDALFSYMYNFGPDNYRNKSPKMQKALKEKNWEEVAVNMDADYDNKIVPGIRKRRDYERRLFGYEFDEEGNPIKVEDDLPEDTQSNVSKNMLLEAILGVKRDNTNIPGVVYSDKFEKLGDELPFVGLIPEVSVSAELNPEEYREAMKRAEARRGRNYVYAGQKEAFPLLAGITGLGAASSLAGAGILGPVLNTSMDALGVISNPLDPTNYLSIYPGGLSLGKNIRDYLPDDYVALKDMEMHVPEKTLSAIAGNFKRNIASKFPKYYDDADISAARRFESGLRGESLGKYRDIVDFIRDNDIRDYKDLKEISSGLSQNEMRSVKAYISRRNQNIYNRDEMLKKVESYISDLDNFKYSDSLDLGEGIGGMYNRRFDLVAVNPYAGSETVIHELRHRMDTGPNAIKLNPMQLIYLDDAYKVGTNPMIESSGEQFEKIATNAELFERYRRKYKKYRKENGIDSSKYSIDDLYKYIDEQDPEDMLIELEHINAYGSDYANSIREYAGESHDKLNERIGKLKKALNYTPSILMGVSSYLSNGDNDYRDGGLIEKQDYIYNRLTSEYDIPPMQAAAIVANLTHESGLRTGALGDSGASYGLQQWRDERRKNLNQFAKERGHVEPTIDDQIDYLMYEYNNGRAFQFSTRGQNLYQTGKSKNKTFDYYQFSKSDFDNAASLRDAVIAWNQGVGRPNKEFSMNDRRYKIAADIAYRHGIKDGEKNYYNDMGYLPDGEMSGIHLPEVDIVANQPSQIPTEEQKKTDYYNTYGRQIVSQMMSFKPESQSVPTSQDVSKESDKMYQDAVRISKAIAENKEAEKRKMLIEAFLPNIQLAVKGVTQVGK